MRNVERDGKNSEVTMYYVVVGLLREAAYIRGSQIPIPTANPGPYISAHAVYAWVFPKTPLSIPVAPMAHTNKKFFPCMQAIRLWQRSEG